MKRSTKFAPAISALILAACGGSGDHSVPVPCPGSEPGMCKGQWVFEPTAGTTILEGTGGMAGAPGQAIGGAPVEGSGGYWSGNAGGAAASGEAGDVGAGGSAVGGEGGAPAAGGDSSGGGSETGGMAGAGGTGVDPCPWVSDCYARIDACRASGAAGCDSMIPTCGQLAAKCGSSNPPSDPSACRHNVDVCLSQYDDCVAFGDTGCLHIIDVCAALAHDCE